MESRNDDHTALDTPLDPAAMLELMQREQAEIPRRIAKQIPWILLAWGLAFLIGYGMLWLIDGARPALAVPLPVSVAIFVAVFVAAIAISAVIGARAQRGIRSTPAATFTGTVYGITATVSFFAMYVFAAGLAANGMHGELQSIFFPTAMGIVIAIMYFIASAIWHAIPTIVLGAGILIVSLVAPFFGYPNHYLFFALAGGAVFLGGEIAVAVYVKRGR